VGARGQEAFRSILAARKFDPSRPLAFRIADAFGLAIEEVFERDE
jgi:DNA-binding XRE family transcriptional regulator